MPLQVMPDSGHKRDAPEDLRAVTALVHALRPDADSLARDAAISFSTAQKWYSAKKPTQPTAAKLLRIIAALGDDAVKVLVNHVRKWPEAGGEVVAGNRATTPQSKGATKKHSRRAVTSAGAKQVGDRDA